MTKYLEYLTPDRCYIIHRSKEYANTLGANLRTEPIYNSQFGVEKIDDAALQEWACAMPREGEQLGHPLFNPFVPTGRLRAVKAARIGGKPGKPQQIRGQNDRRSMVFFKKDDTFDQPYVWAKVTLLSNDLAFPANRASKTFIVMWLEMFNEECRELNYTATQAGVAFKSNWSGEAVSF